jgi:hypothetical protein
LRPRQRIELCGDPDDSFDVVAHLLGPEATGLLVWYFAAAPPHHEQNAAIASIENSVGAS